MLKMDELKEVIQLCLYSAYIEDEKPISLLIIAEPESGKTQMLKKFRHNKGIVYFTDLTAYGITKAIFPLLESGQKVNHIIIPDLLNPLSKSQVATKGFIQFMNSLIEEGICEIYTYAIQIKKEDLNVGLISAITSDAFFSRKTTWKKIGFLSRVIPFSYKYGIGSVIEIMESIYKEEYHNEEKVSLCFPNEKKKIFLSKELAKEMFPFTLLLAKQSSSYGFRVQKQLQILLKSSALLDGRSQVEMKDVEKLKRIVKFLNFSRNTID